MIEIVPQQYSYLKVKYGWGFNSTKNLKSPTTGDIIDQKCQSNVRLEFPSIDNAKIRYS